jgi:hypothetical protein
MKRLALAALLASTAAGAAVAADTPAIVPTRDVDVLYQAEQNGQTLQQRLRWDMNDQLMRVDSPSPGLWMLVNYRNRTIDLVNDPDRSILDLGKTAGPLPGEPGGTSFVRRGSNQIAGIPCTDWQATDTQGQPTLACLTADGVLLRATRGDQVLIQASRVTYGPQNPALFQLPAGYTRSQPPPAGPATGQAQ